MCSSITLISMPSECNRRAATAAALFMCHVVAALFTRCTHMLYALCRTL
jgi:hypothetical protein